MNDHIQLFTLQLREQLAGLREVSVQGRWNGPAPASLPRAVIATRLLAGSSELLGVTVLHDWLRILLELLNWIAENPHGALAAYEPVLREIVAFEEVLIEGLDAGRTPEELVAPERVARLRQGFAAAAREHTTARARAASGAPPRPEPEPAQLRLVGLDDPQAVVSWESMLAIIERLVTKVPHPRPTDGSQNDEERTRRQQRWREVRSLGDALFETEDYERDAASAEAETKDPHEALPLLPGGALFQEALGAGWREGLTAVKGDPVACGEGQEPWTLRWRVPGLTVEGAPPGSPGVDELFPAEEQSRYGRLLGLMATDLCQAIGPGAPRWLLLVDLGAERVTAEFRRPPGRLPAEAARALGHLLEEDFLIESPSLRAALRRLRRDGALVHAHFGPRGEGCLQVVLPLHLAGAPEVCVLSLVDAEVAAPLHLVEAVVSAQGWQRRGAPDGDTLVRENQSLLAVDLASWVDMLMPTTTSGGGGHLALVGLVEKRVALLTTGPARRVAVVRYVETPVGWEAVARSGVETAAGVVLPLLDIEKVLSLRLSHVESVDGGGGDPAADWSPVVPASVSPASTSAPVGAPEARILLLVASRFRADDLEEKLVKSGYAVTVCAEPGEARECLRSRSIDAIICDNAEPERCLDGLLALLAQHGETAPGPVILATGNSGEPARRLARRLGAAGVWTPPYLVDELRSQLV
jgi:CheY-like chemotaxis protein